MNDERNKKLVRLAEEATRHNGYMESERGWMRYEAVRKLSAKEFADICQRVVREGVFFDDIVDELILERLGRENE